MNLLYCSPDKILPKDEAGNSKEQGKNAEKNTYENTQVDYSAQFCLSSTRPTIKEISVLCGYDTNICFLRYIKERTGVTPSEYREKIFNVRV